ncbi:MAG: hypothetical protein JWP61_1799 [Friedmanniella sp.]|nr:hypothetical protein [Friedmanniella sp.]
MSTRRSPYPAEVPAWMAGEAGRRVLDLASGAGGFAGMLHDQGHEVFCVDRDPAAVAAVAERLGTGLHVAGQVESLPFLSCHFDVVTAAQTLHHFAPGLAMTEIARVLKPGGHLAVVYTTRDDTVPWVKRLIAIVRQADPDAMSGAYGVSSLAAVQDSPYFGAVEKRSFRTWVPINRGGLVAMVERRPAVQRLSVADRTDLLAEVGRLYDTSARAPEPLLLPFRTSAWRAVVDHTQLSLDAEDDLGLEIRL